MQQRSVPPGPGRFQEHRDELRCTVQQPLPGEVYLKDRHHVQPVQAIRDVSARGVSLFVHDALLPGEPVVIELRQSEGPVQWYAYVCWCRSDDSPEPPSAAACGDGAAASGCSRHIAGLRVYGPQSLVQLLAPIGATVTSSALRR